MRTSDVRRLPVILVAEDDEDDRLLALDALRDAGDAQDLLDSLRHEGRYADGTIDAPRPQIILLDLNMPRKDVREALAEIKTDASLRQIPIVVLTTSRDREDVFRTYDLGVNSFITKPNTFAGLVELMRTWTRYWFDIAELPGRAAGGTTCWDAPDPPDRGRRGRLPDHARPARGPGSRAVPARLGGELRRRSRADRGAGPRRLPWRLPPRRRHRFRPPAGRGLCAPLSA